MTLEGPLYNNPPGTEVTIRTKAPIQRVKPIQLDVNGVWVTTLLEPAGLTYQLTRRDYYPVETLLFGTGPVVVDEYTSSPVVEPFGLDPFQPPHFHESGERLVNSLRNRNQAINPFALRAGYHSNAFVVADVPVLYEGATINTLEPGHHTHRIVIQPVGFTIEPRSIMWQRFTRQSGLSLRLALVEDSIFSRTSPKDEYFQIADTLHSLCLPLEEALRCEEQTFSELSREEDSDRYEAIMQYDRSVSNQIGRNLRTLLLKADDQDREYTFSEVLTLLHDLPAVERDKIDNVRLRAKALGVISFVLSDLPQSVFILPDYIGGALGQRIAKSIQEYYEQLGRFPEFKEKYEFENVLEIAFKAYLDGIPDPTSGMTGFKAKAESYREEIHQECIRIIKC